MMTPELSFATHAHNATWMFRNECRSKSYDVFKERKDTIDQLSHEEYCEAKAADNLVQFMVKPLLADLAAEKRQR